MKNFQLMADVHQLQDESGIDSMHNKQNCNSKSALNSSKSICIKHKFQQDFSSNHELRSKSMHKNSMAPSNRQDQLSF